MRELTGFVCRHARGGPMTSENNPSARVVEDENRRLKQIVADQTLDIQALHEECWGHGVLLPEV